MNTTLSVAAIEHGTVIDHISAGQALTIIRLLDLPQDKKKVTVGLNLPSKRFNTKDIIKVEDRLLTKAEANQIAILAPHATFNIIRNYETAKKFQATLPDEIHHVIVCPNPNCITNAERMRTRFHVHAASESPPTLTCHYCEKRFARDDITQYNH